MIQASGLTKIFPSGTKAVDELDLHVKEGEIFALLGPNGAGKTTTIRICSTLSGFDAGNVRVAGYDVDRDPEKVRESIGVVAQQTGIDYFLTGRENLVLQGHLYRMKKTDIQARVEELAAYFELKDSLDQLVATYSGGMRRKLDIATALIHRPKIVFLDEPTLGLDIKSRKNLWAYIEKLNRELGLTILLTTHYLEEADKLSHQVAIINAGKIRITGTPEELKTSIHGDSVQLTFEQNDAQVGAFAHTLKNQPEIKDTVWQGNKLHIYVENGAASVPHIALIASQQGVHIKTLSLSRPTLDDVFLKYTGSSLEETKEDTGQEWWMQWAGKGGGGNWQKKWGGGQEDASDDNSNPKDTETPEAASSSPAQAWTKEEMAEWWKNKGQPSGVSDTVPDNVEAASPSAQPINPAQTWTKEEMEGWWKNQGQSSDIPATPDNTAPPRQEAAPSSVQPTNPAQTWTKEEMEEWWRNKGQSPWPADNSNQWGGAPSNNTGENQDSGKKG
ncbi:MAG: ATP-binding cassette domain-containing protein [Gammaproteobacteria bacterium]|nr:ATP-binding cassette domain-containing protein [Gammaproteobacteria bacterium]